MVAGRRFAGEEKSPRWNVRRRIVAQSMVEHDDLQRVQQLPFVFVDTLDLGVEDLSPDQGYPGIDSSQPTNRVFVW